MKLDFFGTKKKKDKSFLILDIGTEAVKVLFSRKGADGKITILGAATQYFEKYGVFDGKDFETNVIKKAISKAIEKAYQNFIFFLAKKKTKKGKQDWKKWPVLLGLPANILKGRVVWQFVRRESPKEKISKSEQKYISEQVFKEAKKEISQRFSQEFGILPKDIHWITQKVLEVKIDGYPVPGIRGYGGRDLEFKILATFLPKYYLENIEKILKDLKLKILKIVHIAENLPVLWGDKKIDGIFFDVGGEITQIFLVKAGSLQQVNEFKAGGKAFSQKLSEVLGVEEDSARNLKERYTNKLLSAETRGRIKEIFLEEKKIWYEDLKLEINKMTSKALLPSNIFLFGGGSLPPEIEGIFKETGINGEDLLISNVDEVKFIYPKDFENIEGPIKKLRNPQYSPTLLLTS